MNNPILNFRNAHIDIDGTYIGLVFPDGALKATGDHDLIKMLQEKKILIERSELSEEQQLVCWKINGVYMSNLYLDLLNDDYELIFWEGDTILARA